MKNVLVNHEDAHLLAKSLNQVKQEGTELPCETILRLLDSGWSISDCGAEFIEIYLRGSRGEIPLPVSAVEAFNSAGWSVTYRRAQFVPPPWWVSTEPIELDGVYRIETRNDGQIRG